MNGLTETAVLIKAEKLYNQLEDLASDTVEMFAIANVIGTVLNLRMQREQEQRQAQMMQELPGLV